MIKEKQQKLFFIIGVGRSGTSLLQEIMNTFSGFCNKKESKVGGAHSMTCWTRVRKSNDFSYLDKFIEENWTSEYFVEKTPDSLLCIPEAIHRFPKANYIFLERDPKKIVLSQLNLFSSQSDDFLERQYHIQNLITKKGDFFLNSEQYWAKLTLNQVRLMITNKKLITNNVTIKYENLIDSLKSNLELLETKFRIKKNIEKVKNIMNKPSYSSKSTKYERKSLNDEKAVSMVNEACKLLEYDQI